MSLFDEEEFHHKLLKLTMDTSWAGILIADRKGRRLYANSQYEQLASQTGGLFREKISAIELALEQKREVLLVQAASCDNRVFLIRGVPCFDARGEVVCVVCHLLELSALQHCAGVLGESRLDPQEPFEDSVRIAGENGVREEKLLFKSRAMHAVMEQISLAAQTDAAVFIRGEPGTGKELFARRLHDGSGRRDKPFLKLDCAAASEGQLEAALFGCESGGFGRDRAGLLERAAGGTLFLDEIGAMPLSLQSGLLRVLQERSYTRHGSRGPVKADVRFLAASSRDIEGMVQAGAFREDLYYRLNIIPIRIPALRERREDIPLLVRHFLQQLNREHRRQETISPEALEAIAGKPFPGNVRQLRSFLERMVILAAGDCLSAGDVERFYASMDIQEDRPESPGLGKKSLQELMDGYEKYILTEYKKKYKSSRQVARQLGTNQSTISRKFQKYHI